MQSPTEMHSQMEVHHEHPITPYKNLLVVLGILLFLTAITIGASHIDFGGHRNTWVSILIAATKCTFVLLYFMHLKYETKLFKITFITSLFVLAIFISFIFWDVSFR